MATKFKTTPYTRGRNFEYRVEKDLQARGFFATRAAGSKGAADIIALGFGYALLVSVKVNGQIPPAEREALVATAEGTGLPTVPLLAERDGRALRYWVVTRGLYRASVFEPRKKEPCGK